MFRQLLLQMLTVTTSVCGLMNFLRAEDGASILHPVPYQVIQRVGFHPALTAEVPANPGYATIPVRLKFAGDRASGNARPFRSEYRILETAVTESDVSWSPLDLEYDQSQHEFKGSCVAMAGGWYRLEVRFRNTADEPWIETKVEPIGVGELFLVAGQSYATNTNDERLRVEDERLRVAAYDVMSDRWQTAHDPQPAPDKTDGGSIWPPLGDLLAAEYSVPIGFANVAVGGTSSDQWQPAGELFPRLVQAGKLTGRFRAVLWQQGESDVISGTSREKYVRNLQAIRTAAVRTWGFEPVWLCAKSTHHPTVYEKPEDEQRIRDAIGDLSVMSGFGAGPDTDLLRGENRGGLGSRRHFSGLGQRRAAAMWGEVLTDRLDRVPSGVDAATFLLRDLHLLEPAWESEVVFRESTVLRIHDSSDVACARLAFSAAEILEIATANGATRIAREQVEMSADGVTLKFPGDLPVEAISDDAIYLPQDAPNSYRHRRDHPEQNLLYRPGRWFHDRNLEITYRRRKTADVVPRPAVVSGSLPSTQERLRVGQPLKIGISGDSISTGLDASLTTAAAPFQPGYPELVVAQLRVLSDSDVTCVNRAVAGWSVANGLQDLDTLLAARPELIVIAYGMNDVGRKDPKWFREQNEALIRRIRGGLPQSEILLVCTMLGNREWIHTPREMFSEYRDVLLSFASSGTAVADLTEVWGQMLKSKDDLDLTGNGLNHPNDFGHRLYAQAILKLLAPAR